MDSATFAHLLVYEDFIISTIVDLEMSDENEIVYEDFIISTIVDQGNSRILLVLSMRTS